MVCDFYVVFAITKNTSAGESKSYASFGTKAHVNKDQTTLLEFFAQF